MASAYLDGTTPLAIAHRGGAVDGAENTLSAFGRAVDAGYVYLETDVHLTADGVLIAFHDDELDRVTDRSGRVDALPWAQLRQARVAGVERIPTLAEVLEAFPDVRINVDPKTDDTVEPLVRTLRETYAVDRVLIGSFDQRRLLRVRRLLPGVATSMGPWEVRALKLAAEGFLPRALVPTWAGCAQVPETHEGRRIVDRAFVRTAHARGLQVHVWTVNEAADMHRLLNFGVDGIITDAIEVLREVLAERGRWTGRVPGAAVTGRSCAR